MRLDGGFQGASTFDAAAASKAYGTKGQWQDYEVQAFKSWVTVRVNGVYVNRTENVPPSGFLGLQCESGIVDYRSFRIKED